MKEETLRPYRVEVTSYITVDAKNAGAAADIAVNVIRYGGASYSWVEDANVRGWEIKMHVTEVQDPQTPSVSIVPLAANVELKGGAAPCGASVNEQPAVGDPVVEPSLEPAEDF